MLVPGGNKRLCAHGERVDPPLTGLCRPAVRRFGCSASRLPQAGRKPVGVVSLPTECAADSLADLLRLHDASLATVATAEGSRLQLTLPGRGKAA